MHTNPVLTYGQAFAPGFQDWELEHDENDWRQNRVPGNWFCDGRVVECAFDFEENMLVLKCNREVRSGVLCGWAGEAAPLYPAVCADEEGTVLELLP